MKLKEDNNHVHSSYFESMISNLYVHYNQFQRPLMLGIFLFGIQFLQRLSLAMSLNLRDRIINSNGFNSDFSSHLLLFLSSTRLIFPKDIVSSTSHLQVLLIGITCLHLFFIWGIIASFALCFITVKKQYIKTAINTFFIMNSCCLKIYYYILFIPVLSLSFESLGQGILLQNISLVNIFLAIIAGIFSVEFDFSVDFIPRDILNSRPNIYKLLGVVRDLICCLISSKTSAEITLITTGLTSLFAVAEFYIGNGSYFHKYSNQFQLFSSISILLGSISSLIFLGFQSSCEWLILMLVSFPLSFVLSRIFSQAHIKNCGQFYLNLLLNQGIDSDISPEQFEGLVKYLHTDDHFYEDYVFSPNQKGLLFETLIIHHYKSCTGGQCFCSDIFSSGKSDGEWSKEDMLGERQRKTFTNKVILSLFQKYLVTSKQKTLQIHLLYTTFLLEVYQVQTKCLTEILSCKNSSHWRDRVLQEDLTKRIENYVTISLSSAHTENQRFNMLACVQFDDLLNASERQLRATIPIYKDYLHMISLNNIDLEDLEMKAVEYLKERNSFESKLRLCYLLNPESKELTELTYIFTDYFDFRERRPKDLKKESHLNHSQRAQLVTSPIVFSDMACVVFVSLLQPIGIIRKASANFYKLIGCDKTSQVESITINQFLPVDVAKHHDAVLVSFIDSDSYKFIGQPIQQLFFVDKKNFLIPIEVKFKIDYIEQQSEFGVTAFVKKLEPERDFMTFHISGKISEITSRLYSYLFVEKTPYSLDKINALDLYRLIPSLGVKLLLLEDIKNKVLKLHIILPKNDIRQNLGFRQKQSSTEIRQNLFKYVDSMEIYDFFVIEADIELKTMHITARKADFFYISVNNVKKVDSQQERRNILFELRQQSSRLLTPSERRLHSKQSFQQSFQTSVATRAQQNMTQYFINDNEYDENILNQEQTMRTDSGWQDENEEEEDSDEGNEEEDEDEEEEQQEVLSEKRQHKRKEQTESSVLKKQGSKNLNKGIDTSNPQKKTEKQSILLNNSIQGKENATLLSALKGLNKNNSINNSFPSNSQVLEGVTSLSGHYQPCIEENTSRDVTSYQQQYLSERLPLNPDNHELSQIEPDCSPNSIDYSPNRLFENSPAPTADSYSQRGVDFYDKIILDHETENINKNAIIQENPTKNEGISPRIKSIEESILLLEKVPIKQKKLKRKKKNKRDSEFQSKDVFTVENNRKNVINIASSVNSTRSANFQKKFDLIKQIVTKKQDRFLQFIHILGFISLIILVTVSSVLFSKILTLFTQELNTLFDIPYAVSIRADYSLIIKNKELEILLVQDVFGLLTNPQNQQKVTQMLDTLGTDNFDKFHHYKNMEIQYYSDTKLSGLKEYMLNKTNLIPLKNYKENGKYVTVNMTLTQAFLFIQENLYEYMLNGVNRLTSYNNIQQNFIVMFAQYANIQTAVMNEALFLFDEISSLLWISLWVIISISFAFILIIFPLYAKIQQRREKILKLNATFEPLKLDQTVFCLEKLMEQSNLLKQKKDRNSLRQSQQRNVAAKTIKKQPKKHQPHKSGARNSQKKTLSQTTSISKINIVIVLVSVLIFFLLCVYPITNLVVINGFMTEGKFSLQELSSLYSARAQLTSNYAANYMAMSGCLQEGPLDTTKYKRVHSLASTNQAKLAEILAILDNFQGTRYNQAAYSGFFLQIIKGNICQSFENYPQYITEENQMDMTQCKYENEGLMTKGLYVSLKNVFQKFEDVLPAFDKQSIAGFIIDMHHWITTFDFFEFNTLYFNLIKVIESLRFFMTTLTNDYFSFIVGVSYGLFFYSITCLVLVFIFCWLKFFSLVQEALEKTRTVLTALPISSLMENPYVISFLVEESKQ